MKLSKNDLVRIKQEYSKIGFRERWNKDDGDLIIQLIENGIYSPDFIRNKFFPKRSKSALENKISEIRRGMIEKNKS